MNTYEPKELDVMEWVNTPGSRWPAGDWDYYVMNGNNDELVLKLANTESCPKQQFFVHCLYYLVGDYVNAGMMDQTIEQRINALLDGVDSRSSSEVEAWRTRTLAALRSGESIDPTEWLHFGM